MNWQRFILLSVIVGLLFVPSVKAVASDTVTDVLDRNDGLIDNRVTSIAIDEQASLMYIGTQEGLSVYNLESNSFVDNVTFSDTPYRNYVFDMCVTPGGVYLVTSALEYPLKSYFWREGGGELSNVLLHRSTSAPSLTSVGVTENDSIFCVGTNGNGLLVYDTHSATVAQYTTASGLTSNVVWSVLRAEVNAGHEWFFLGTESGVSIFDATSSEIVTDEVLGTISHLVRAMLYDAGNRRLYVGTPEGLFAYSLDSHGTSLVDGFPLTQDDGLASSNVLSLAIDGDQLYIGTSKGLHKYDLTKMDRTGLYRLDFSNGILDDAVSALAVHKSGSAGTIYAGTIGGGVAVVRISYGLTWGEWLVLYAPVITVLSSAAGIATAFFECRRRNRD